MGLHVPEDFDAANTAYLESFAPDGGGTLLPDNAIITGLISVVAYIDPDEGYLRWFLYTHVDLPISQGVGLLEMAKMELISRTPGAVTRLSPPMDDDDD